MTKFRAGVVDWVRATPWLHSCRAVFWFFSIKRTSGAEMKTRLLMFMLGFLVLANWSEKAEAWCLWKCGPTEDQVKSWLADERFFGIPPELRGGETVRSLMGGYSRVAWLRGLDNALDKREGKNWDCEKGYVEPIMSFHWSSGYAETNCWTLKILMSTQVKFDRKILFDPEFTKDLVKVEFLERFPFMLVRSLH